MMGNYFCPLTPRRPVVGLGGTVLLHLRGDPGAEFRRSSAYSSPRLPSVHPTASASRPARRRPRRSDDRARRRVTSAGSASGSTYPGRMDRIQSAYPASVGKSSGSRMTSFLLMTGETRREQVNRAVELNYLV